MCVIFPILRKKKKKKGKVGGTRSAKNTGASGAVCGCSFIQRRRVNVLWMQCLDNKLLLKSNVLYDCIIWQATPVYGTSTDKLICLFLSFPQQKLTDKNNAPEHLFYVSNVSYAIPSQTVWRIWNANERFNTCRTEADQQNRMYGTLLWYRHR